MVVKLSIVVLFCDKDYQYLDDMIDMILKHVSCEYEVVFVDNRLKTKHVKLTRLRIVCRKPNFKYIDMNGNARQLKGKKAALEVVSGEKVWFIDVDDKIKDMNDEILSKCTSDIDIFNFLFTKGNYAPQPSHLIDQQLDMQDKMTFESFYHTFHMANWSRIFSTSFIKSVFDKYIPNVECSLGEDILTSFIAYYYADSMASHNEIIYEFMLDRSFSSRDKLKSAEEVNVILTGYQQTLDLFNIAIQNYFLQKEFALEIYVFIARVLCKSPDQIMRLTVPQLDRSILLSAIETILKEDILPDTIQLQKLLSLRESLQS